MRRASCRRISRPWGSARRTSATEPHPADHRPLSPAPRDRRCGRAAVGEAAGGLAADPDAAFLRGVGAGCPVTLVHLIHRKEAFESETKDYEFTRLSMHAHWTAGMAAVEHTLGHRAWRSRRPPTDGIQIFDLGRDVEPHRRKHHP
ncbi:MAG: DUF3734 domain-containing protein [Geminicoccaceae bacterium]